MGKGRIVLIIMGGVFLVSMIVYGVMFAFPTFCFFHLMAPPRQGMRETRKDFQKNKELILMINSFLIESEYDNIFIPPHQEKGTIYVGSGYGDVPVNNEKVVEAIVLLRKKGYSTIGKKANCVYFVRWTGKDVGKGIVYSIDGHEPNESSLQYLTKIEPMKENGWYYYEEDYNEWRVRNRS